MKKIIKNKIMFLLIVLVLAVLFNMKSIAAIVCTDQGASFMCFAAGTDCPSYCLGEAPPFSCPPTEQCCYGCLPCTNYCTSYPDNDNCAYIIGGYYCSGGKTCVTCKDTCIWGDQKCNALVICGTEEGTDGCVDTFSTAHGTTGPLGADMYCRSQGVAWCITCDAGYWYVPTRGCEEIIPGSCANAAGECSSTCPEGFVLQENVLAQNECNANNGKECCCTGGLVPDYNEVNCVVCSTFVSGPCPTALSLCDGYWCSAGNVCQNQWFWNGVECEQASLCPSCPYTPSDFLYWTTAICFLPNLPSTPTQACCEEVLGETIERWVGITLY